MPKSKTNPKPESARAAAACEEYCALGPTRSLLKLAKHLQERPDWLPPVPALYTIEHWSAAYGWQERARSYDAERAEERARQRERQVEAMNRRHARAARKVFDSMADRLVVLAEIHEVGAHAAAVAMKNAADIERAARGIPQQVEVKAIVEGSVTHEHDFTDNPALAAHARALLLGVSGGTTDPSGAGVPGEQSHVHPGTAPGALG